MLLYGVGQDFDIRIQPSSGTIIAGLNISLAVVVTPNWGFTGDLPVACTNLPPGASCAPVSVNISTGSPVTSQLILSTTSKYTVIGYGGFGSRGILSVLAAATGLLLLMQRRRTRLSRAIFAALLGIATLSQLGCSGRYPDQNANYTPAGTYTMTVTATHGSIVRTASYTLTVNSK